MEQNNKDNHWEKVQEETQENDRENKKRKIPNIKSCRKGCEWHTCE